MEKILEYIVNEKEDGRTVEYILKNSLNLTAHQIRSLKFREQGILLQGVRCRVTAVCHAGELLRLCLEEPDTGSDQLVPRYHSLDIRYEDEDVIVVNKPAGVAVHPSPGHFGDTLANDLAGYFEQKNLWVTIRAIGRLDLETCGLVLFAKNAVAAQRLSQADAVRKEYIALAEGIFADKEGCVRYPLRKMPGELNKMEALSDENDEAFDTGYKAVTHYHVISQEEDHSRIRLWLETGRTHQIRVHMASIGHPLLGDRIYGLCDALKKDASTVSKHKECVAYNLPYAALCCVKIVFRHPFEEEDVFVEIKEPF